MIELTCGTSSAVGRIYFAKPEVLVRPLSELVVLHQPLSQRLYDAAFDLALHALRIHRAADIVRRPDAEHLYLTGHRIDLDLGDLSAEYIGLPGSARAVDRIETRGIGAETMPHRPGQRLGFWRCAPLHPS